MQRNFDYVNDVNENGKATFNSVDTKGEENRYRTASDALATASKENVPAAISHLPEGEKNSTSSYACNDTDLVDGDLVCVCIGDNNHKRQGYIRFHCNGSVLRMKKVPLLYGRSSMTHKIVFDIRNSDHFRRDRRILDNKISNNFDYRFVYGLSGSEIYPTYAFRKPEESVNDYLLQGERKYSMFDDGNYGERFTHHAHHASSATASFFAG